MIEIMVLWLIILALVHCNTQLEEAQKFVMEKQLNETCSPYTVDLPDDHDANLRSSLLEGVVGLIIQGTPSAAVPLLIWNARKKFGSTFPFIVFYSEESRVSILAWYGEGRIGNVTAVPMPAKYAEQLGTHRLSRDSLNSLFTDVVFWNDVEAHARGLEHVLIIQDDTWICGGDAHSKISSYLPWADYIGATWGWTNTADNFNLDEATLNKRSGEDAVSARVSDWMHLMKDARKKASAEGELAALEASMRSCNGVGNGGFSLRRIAAMQLLSARFGPSIPLHTYIDKRGIPASEGLQPEDKWYCALLGLLYNETGQTGAAARQIRGRGRRATRREASFFAAEETFNMNTAKGTGANTYPLGIHKIWTRWRPGKLRSCVHHASSVMRGCPGLSLLSEVYSLKPCGLYQNDAFIRCGLDIVDYANMPIGTQGSLTSFLARKNNQQMEK